MQFVDTSTPSSPVTYENVVRADRGKLADGPWQLSNDWASMYYQNAYNTALLNYMNAYNSPLQQMLRYQDAGISKWAAAQNPDPGNMSQGHAGAKPSGNFTAPSQLEKRVKTLQSINDVVGAAQQLYNYISYGAKTNAYAMDAQQWNSKLAEQNFRMAFYNSAIRENELAWSNWWNRGITYNDPETGQVSENWNVPNSPRATYMQNSTDEKLARVKQLMALVDVVYPSQADANSARAALLNYQTQLLQGKYGAIINLNTGNKTGDDIMRLLLLQMMSDSGNIMNLIGKAL